MPTKATIEVEIPDGWEFVRWDYAMEGEFYLGDPSSPTECISQQTAYRHVIVRKVITYREPEARDVGKEVEVGICGSGGVLECRTATYIGNDKANGVFVCRGYSWFGYAGYSQARVKVSP